MRGNPSYHISQSISSKISSNDDFSNDINTSFINNISGSSSSYNSNSSSYICTGPSNAASIIDSKVKYLHIFLYIFLCLTN
jgi:hypothetical protein